MFNDYKTVVIWHTHVFNNKNKTVYLVKRPIIIVSFI